MLHVGQNSMQISGVSGSVLDAIQHAGNPVATLTDFEKLYVNFDVPQQKLGLIQVGQSVQVDTDVPGLGSVAATISAIEPQVNTQTRNVTVQASMNNAGNKFQPGMFAFVAVELPETPDMITVPASAIMTSPSGDTAIVVRDISDQEIGVAEIVAINVGRRVGNRAVIDSGLEAGDVLITRGQLRVRPGAQVHVLNEELDSGVE